MSETTTGQRGAQGELHPDTEARQYCPIGDTHTVRGGGGLQLHVREWGNPDGPPILFIHGWSQNHLCWTKQVGSPLAQEFRLVALDNRGHGMSDKPLEAEHYTDPQRWADDIAAVINALHLDRPVLVGWPYGGLIMCDYLRAYGQAAIAGINFVGGAVTLGERAFGIFIGPGFLEGTVALSDRPTRPVPPAHSEAVRPAFKCPLCHDFSRCRGACLSSLLHGEDALRLNATVPVRLQPIANFGQAW